MTISPPDLAIIPLRKGSKGLPGKNIRPLLGRPLFMHTVEQALQAGIKKIIISTNIQEVLETSLPGEVILHSRPSILAGDNVTMDLVLVNALDSCDCSGLTVALLQATTPLRRSSDIQGAQELYAQGRFDLVMSVCETDRSVLKYGFVAEGRYRPLGDPNFTFSNRQCLPKVWRPNGAVYIFGADWFLGRGTLVCENIGAYPMDQSLSYDIDTLEDFERCAQQLSLQQGGDL